MSISPETEATEDESDDSVGGALRAAYAELEAKGAEETPAEESAQASRDRDERGRFASKAEQETQAPVEQGAQAAQAAPTEQPAQAQPVPMLQSWNAEQRAAFANLPPEAQRIVYDRATDMERHFSQRTGDLARKQQEYGHIEQAVSPYIKQWNLEGVSTGQVLGHLLEAQDFSQRDPAGFIRWVAQNSGVNLAELAQGTPQYDPQILTLQQQIQQMQAHIERQQYAQQEQVLTSAQHEIQAFANEAGADGKLVRPHLDQVYPDMQPIVALLRSQNPHASHRAILSEAYERACWQNPTIRAERIQSERAAAEAKRIEGERARAQQARKAGVSVSGAPNGTMGVDFGDSVGSALRAAWELQTNG